jgi:hypothetical protein
VRQARAALARAWRHRGIIDPMERDDDRGA